MKYEDYITIGKIVKSIGLKGDVKVIPLTDFPERYKKLKELVLYSEDKKKFIENKFSGEFSFPIEALSFQKDFIRLKLKDFDKIELSDELKNLFIVIESDKRVKLPKNAYYFYELVNCEVFDKGELRGKVFAVENYGGDDLLKIRLSDNTEILLPLRKEFVQKVDTESRRIETDRIDDFID